MSFYPSGGTQYTLGASIGSTDTTILLSSFTEPISGTLYTMALLGDIAYGTIAPISDNSEFISFTGITQNSDGTATLTGVTRGLARSTPYTSSVTFKLPHAGQSIFILSDAPQLFNEYGAKRNNEVITGFWEAPNPITAQGLVPRDYMLALINGGAITTNNIVVTGVAGETITKDQLVYLKVSDGRWWKCDADTASTVDNVQLGLAQGAGSAASNITGGVLIAGYATLTAISVTAATKYYASNTAGGISTTAGTTEVSIGISPSGSTTTLYFMPRFDQQLTEDQQDALVGSSGTPSASNKYVTEASLPTYANIFSSGSTTKNTANTTSTVVAHGLGVTPRFVRMRMLFNDTTTVLVSDSSTAYNGTTQNSIYTAPRAANGEIGATFTVGNTAYGLKQSGTVTFDATNVTIAWSGSTGAGTAYILWEAEY